jgi:hypothetical protein
MNRYAMKKYIWFLLGFLLSLWSVPAYAETWTYFGASTTAGTCSVMTLENPLNSGPQLSYGRITGFSSPYQSDRTGTGYMRGRTASGGSCYTDAQTYTTGRWYRISYSGTSWKMQYSTDYIPPPSEPATCTDGVVSGDETGIDCGGSCLASCVSVCPPGSELLVDDCTDSQERCMSYTATNSTGSCPSGWEKSEIYCNDPLETGACIKAVDYILAADPDIELDEISAPWSPGPVQTDSVTSSVTSVDNGDGTTTNTTTTTSVTNSDDPDSPGSETTITTYVETVDNSTGGVTGYTQSSQTTPAPEDSSSNYDWSAPTYTQSDFDGSIDGSILPDEPDLVAELTGNGSSQGSGIKGLINDVFVNSGVAVSETACYVSGEVYGQSIAIDFCKPMYTDIFSAAGVVLLAIANIYALFISFGKDD